MQLIFKELNQSIMAYLTDAERKQIQASIRDMEDIIKNSNDENLKTELRNKIAGLKERLRFSSNPDRGF